MTAHFGSAGFDPEFLDPDRLDPEEAGEARRISARIFDAARRAAGQIPFMEDVIAGYYCALDPATPRRVRGAILAALAYFVMPMDMIPDMLVGIGFTDDASVLMGVMTLIRAHVRDEHLAAARNALKRAPRKRA